MQKMINFFITISIVTKNAMIETTVMTGKSGKTLPLIKKQLFGTFMYFD